MVWSFCGVTHNDLVKVYRCGWSDRGRSRIKLQHEGPICWLNLLIGNMWVCTGGATWLTIS